MDKVIARNLLNLPTEEAAFRDANKSAFENLTVRELALVQLLNIIEGRNGGDRHMTREEDVRNAEQWLHNVDYDADRLVAALNEKMGGTFVIDIDRMSKADSDGHTLTHSAHQGVKLNNKELFLAARGWSTRAEAELARS